MTRITATFALMLTLASRASAHSGPPFPIVTDRIAGAYRVSIWTDPDTTDDGKPGGQFWIVIGATAEGRTIPQGTQAEVAIHPVDRPGARRDARARPVNGATTRQFAALVMDHEGRFAVHVAIDGPLGPATLDGEVDATYDLRPAPALVLVYLLPFAAVGALWMKALRRRRRAPASRSSSSTPSPLE
jgi:hypothetical protein